MSGLDNPDGPFGGPPQDFGDIGAMRRRAMGREALQPQEVDAAKFDWTEPVARRRAVLALERIATALEKIAARIEEE